jgi:hypothetical protein
MPGRVEAGELRKLAPELAPFGVVGAPAGDEAHGARSGL